MINGFKFDKFQSETYGELKIDEVAKIIRFFLESDKCAQYSLVIGSDSHEKKEGKKRTANIVTAIVVHKKGHGGIYFWSRQQATQVYSLRDKINKETFTSLSLATGFVPLLNEALNGSKPNYHLEIHVDVGEHGQTRDMIKEIVGMVNGNGFVAKTKPDAYGASYVADKHA